MWDEDIEPLILQGLIRAYIRRKTWEAKLAGAGMGVPYAAAPKGQPTQANQGGTLNGKRVAWVHPDDFLKRVMG